MTSDELKGTLEALLFTSESPLSIDDVRKILGRVTSNEIKEALDRLKADYAAQGRGLQIEEVAGGARIYTRPEMFQWVRRLVSTRQERRFSIPALETLAIVAYRQPITKAEIEMVRGVNTDGVLETLLERSLVKIQGRREGLGRPILYGTTQKFLEYFGLSSIEDLPNKKPTEPGHPSIDGSARKSQSAGARGATEPGHLREVRGKDEENSDEKSDDEENRETNKEESVQGAAPSD